MPAPVAGNDEMWPKVLIGETLKQRQMVGLTVIDGLHGEFELQSRDAIPGRSDPVEHLIFEALGVGFEKDVLRTRRVIVQNSGNRCHG